MQRNREEREQKIKDRYKWKERYKETERQDKEIKGRQTEIEKAREGAREIDDGEVQTEMERGREAKKGRYERQVAGCDIGDSLLSL